MDSKERNNINITVILSPEAVSGCMRLTRLFQQRKMPDLTPEATIRYGIIEEIEPLLEMMHNLTEEEWSSQFGHIEARSNNNVAGPNPKHLQIKVELTLEAMGGCFRLTRQINKTAPNQTFSETMGDLINIYIVPSFLDAHKMTEEGWQRHIDYMAKFRRVDLTLDLPVEAYAGALRFVEACRRHDPDYSVEDEIRRAIRLQVVPGLIKIAAWSEEEWQKMVADSDQQYAKKYPDRATERETYHDGLQQEIVLIDNE